jgi:hypothetical protein
VYEYQDKKKNRDTSKNVNVRHLPQINNMIALQNNRCYICRELLNFRTCPPTLDRINNNLPHTLENVRIACINCNRLHANRDIKEVQLLVRLSNYAKKNKLSMTLNDKKAVKLILSGIAGGLSNVMHRLNIAGETKINKFRYDEENNSIYSEDTNNIMTHVTGVDFNSLYPSSYSSKPNEHYIWYTNHRMLMPSAVREYTTDERKMKQTIYGRKELFIVSVKGDIPRRYWNEFINFPPIFRNIIPPGSKTKKLTQLLDTNGEFMSFSSYYLWLLIDVFHFEVREVKEMVIFEKNEEGLFYDFVNTFMNRRIEAINNDDDAYNNYCKMILNSAYGKDGMNTSKFSKVQILGTEKAFIAQCRYNFLGSRMITTDVYAIEKKPRSNTYLTPLQNAVFTLDNSKYWYLVFLYLFLFRVVDTEKIHFIEGDTDSIYFAVAGDPEAGIHQGFDNIIKYRKTYEKHIYDWLPKPGEGKADKKALLKLCVENEGNIMVALTPKCYYIKCITLEKGEEKEKDKMRVKGVSVNINDHITGDSYMNVITKKENNVYGKNILLHSNKNVGYYMVKEEVEKKALTLNHNKMLCLNNFSCAPYNKSIPLTNYIIKKN